MSLNNWMGSIKQTTPLYNLSIPGTHDSCALHDEGFGYTQCQWLSITDQLNNGIRFLDIRLRYVPDEDILAAHHGAIYQKITFMEIQQEVTEFLKAHPTEVILMNVQQEYSRECNENFVKRFNEHVEPYEDYWFFDERIPTIQEARGRIVLIRGYDPENFNPEQPTNGGWLTDKGIPWNALTCDGDSENEYFRTQNASSASEKDKKPAIEQMIDAGIIDNRFAINFLSYAHFAATPGRNAEAMNRLINTYIKEHASGKIIGVLPMDFTTNTPGFNEEIIRHNLPWSEIITGDFSGSGKTELAIFVDYGSNTTGLLQFSPSSDGSYQLREVWNSGAGKWEASRMSNVVVGDFTGSGRAEIAVFYDYGNNQTGLWLFTKQSSGWPMQPNQVWDSGLGKWGANRMVDVVVGDFSGTGKQEIGVFYNYLNNQTGLWVFSATSDFQPRQVWDSGLGKWGANRMVDVVVGDFSGTGKQEIAVFFSYSFSTTGVWMFSAASRDSFQHLMVWKGQIQSPLSPIPQP